MVTSVRVFSPCVSFVSRDMSFLPSGLDNVQTILQTILEFDENMPFLDI